MTNQTPKKAVEYQRELGTTIRLAVLYALADWHLSESYLIIGSRRWISSPRVTFLLSCVDMSIAETKDS